MSVEIVEAALAADPGVLVCIVGQTSSGKTDLATRVAARVGGEIVTADSVQIYREFDVGAGKPTAVELARAPHHLVSTVDPMAPIDAARYVQLADAVIADVRARGHVPIVCGGTFLWVKALVQGLAPAPPASEEVRARHRALALAEGRSALHLALAKVDPQSAARLHPNDVVRTSRALEVFEVTGQKMSDLHAAHGFADARHRAKLFALRVEQVELSARIERRVDGFLRDAFVLEVTTLLARGLGDARAMGAVGYKQVAAHCRGKLAASELRGAIVSATRVFARRQRTWLGHEDVEWLEP